MESCDLTPISAKVVYANARMHSIEARVKSFRTATCAPIHPPMQFMMDSPRCVYTHTGEQQYIKGNTKYIAVSLAGGGGPVGIFDHKKPGRVEANGPVIAGHKAAVLDFDFNPFHEHIIATGSDDCTVKVCTQRGCLET